ncbi:MAG: triphosphoribosyl-dephospho-CoA synthase [Firmicutes bacterium]|nr:triphosphoribosyl-dephospho-CoA synthase [Bacillota bacterium]MDD7603112.1 triphosphoribosyl-dephospho-CoA synthase [Bacillota bacterium]MDY5856174.1 triphosphoribosyl-dephospho-CoA synthase [Anaerovoracaceae bacterium]
MTALLGEVWASPKPGLVDRENTGAHQDMTYQNFVDSARALQTCFTKCARVGAAFSAAHASGSLQHSVNLHLLTEQLRSIGLAGEHAMYQATGGVNTHKGAIFSMGVLCTAAAGFPWRRIQSAASSIAAALLAGETKEPTNGKKVLRETGTGGIRAEACSGFDTAFSIGLPSLKEALEAGLCENDALVYTLLRIIAAAEDSNLVHRGGTEGMDFARREALLLTEGGPATMNLDAVREADRKFIEKNLSPGGSADLLALTLFLAFLKHPAYFKKMEEFL